MRKNNIFLYFSKLLSLVDEATAILGDSKELSKLTSTDKEDVMNLAIVNGLRIVGKFGTLTIYSINFVSSVLHGDSKLELYQGVGQFLVSTLYEKVGM